jgi:threonine dehydrogenase-like Zn-dependent dehydrogenase
MAINPVNWIKQHAGQGYAPWIQYPFIMGSDLAGEVVEIGPGVESFNVGDRVLGHAMCMNQRINTSSEGAFQEYTVLRANVVSKIPASLPYEKACVLPLGLSTAARGLFSSSYLALSLPRTSSTREINDDIKPTLVVWGGSTSVGCNAIQLAAAAGYDVITTASPKNHDYLKSLGATATFDYRSSTAVDDIIAFLQQPGRQVVGALAIGLGSLSSCADIFGALPSETIVNTASYNGSIASTLTAGSDISTIATSTLKHNKFIAQVTLDVLPPASLRDQDGPLDWSSLSPSATDAAAKARNHADEKGVKTKFVIASEIVDDEIAGKIYNEFLEEALEMGRYVCAPEPEVVGQGLESLQEALGVSRRGVSARKVVVKL